MGHRGRSSATTIGPERPELKGLDRFALVERAVAHIAEGRPVVIVGEAGTARQGEIVLAAQKATTVNVALLVRHGSGFIQAAIPAWTCDFLQLPPMSAAHRAHANSAFTVSVDAREGVTTGISAADRARTLQALADPDAVPTDLVRPGHIVPVSASDDGVLARAGFPEAAVDIARLAGLAPVGVLCGLVSREDPREMAGREELIAFALEHDLCIVAVQALVDYRRRHGQGAA